MNEALDNLIIAFDNYSVVADQLTSTMQIFNRAGLRFRRHAIMRNHGRARKVSFRRPSPRLSKLVLSEVAITSFEEAALAAPGNGRNKRFSRIMRDPTAVN